MLKASDYPVAPSVDAVFQDASQLYFELSPQELSDPALGAKLTQVGVRNDGKTLQQSVSTKTWRKLQAYATKNNIEVANFQTAKPWFAGLVLTVMSIQKNGFDPALGLDQHLMGRAAKAGKPTQGLETFDFQMALFNELSPKGQDQFLEEALDTGGRIKAEMQTLHTAWRKADEKKLYQDMALKMRRDYPELYESMNRGRNKAWLPKLEALLKDNQKDNILVVVGALHLLGDDGVVKMLADKGYKVERIK
jgi:uncharacterized protein YbaP (TraB family)